MSSPQAAGAAGSSPQHTLTQDEQRVAQLRKLRDPFDPGLVQALPKVSCRACTDSRTKNCDRHKKVKCQRCHNWITEAHVDLDYVGHAELTDRLLQVDPLWTWEPLAFDAEGLPRFDGNRGLWIRLTVCGHTRIGYGDAQGKVGANAIKEAIGDALRNAAMRFGAALDLWAKSDLHAGMEAAADAAGPQDDAPQQAQRPAAARAAAPVQQAAGDAKEQLLADLERKVRNGWNHAGATAQNLAEAEAKQLLDDLMQGPDGEMHKVGHLLRTRLAELQSQQPKGHQSPTVAAAEANPVPAQRERGAA